MKKILNDTELVEAQMIQGLVKAFPRKLSQLEDRNIIVRKVKTSGRVA